ncbi:hypothetical protein KQX54_008535 [Cotesia glomerata]|uniref:Ig-like domain-containing protein n=1 Tax=Cotesia glomerata TaxID=32391 RepID=A0AAV7IR17_COTGL|nr:hypothetical protein KQX54_008535 [Cotesia glomerata]
MLDVSNISGTNKPKTESNATQVTLENLELDAAGEYSCEVSADAPSFHTAIVYATMNVAELPTQRPEIHGLRRKYRIDDTLRVNCTLGRSKPAANLTWYVNDRQPLQSHVRTYSPLDTNDSEWQIAQTSLQFLVTPDHFMSGKLKIRCSASIYDIYWQSTEVSAEEERPRVIQLEPAATIVGINYLQPPPNFQTGQRKPDGHLDVKVFKKKNYLNCIETWRFNISVQLNDDNARSIANFLAVNLDILRFAIKKRDSTGTEINSETNAVG